MSILPKLIYKIKAIPMKIPAGYCAETVKLMQKSYGNAKEPRTGQTLKIKYEVDGPTQVQDPL